MKDRELKELFESYRPTLGCSKQYMAQLSRRLDSVKYIKDYVKTERSHYHRWLIAVFVVGLMMGVAAILYILLNPASLISVMQQLSSDWVLFSASDNHILLSFDSVWYIIGGAVLSLVLLYFVVQSAVRKVL